GAKSVKKSVAVGVLAVGAVVAAAGVFSGRLAADDDHFGHFRFAPDSLVLTRSVYVGNAATVTIGEDLPPGCAGGANGSSNVSVPTTTPGVSVSVAVPCGIASDNGEFPNDQDTHNVWNNGATDGSFGISSPIFLDNLSEDGRLLGMLPIPSDRIVTSFSSKSELALNRSVDGKSLTFMGYHGGPGCGGNPVSPTAPNLIDVSASNTPGICDPTNSVISSVASNPVPTAYYRAVAEVDADGHLSITDGNAYSGDNGRAAIKGGNDVYYMVGNDNSGNLSKKQLPITPVGIELINGTGAELLIPHQPAPLPPNIGMIGRLLFAGDKPGKDTNFRGITISNNTLYISKGSGGNGINTVYQVGTQGTLPTGSAGDLAKVPITILPGFPNTAASTNTSFPFGMFFANANTLYVCDEGDGAMVAPGPNGNVADAQSLATAGVQKWVLQNGTWTMLYALQNGLNIGVPYSVDHYPASLNPATGGCRNMTGRLNGDGTVTIWAVTSTISANGDQGADPNKLVRVTDVVSATTLPTGDGDSDRDDRIGTFKIIRSARAGEVFRGVALAPKHDDEDDRGGHF
ncbi:MAG TPA: hypothetical protein VE077_06100, partial [Candidatus Methylomirabilis sp.]|nr:hypothetical protein [Candidatus Methylomirabilis sp.]